MQRAVTKQVAIAFEDQSSTKASSRLFLTDGSSTFEGADLSTKLKLMGVDVASFGDAFGAAGETLSVTFSDPIANTYKRLVVSEDGTKILGGVLVGDASAYSTLTATQRCVAAIRAV